MSGGISLKHDQSLYVISSGGGYSCLGFDVAEKRIAAYAAWLKREGQALPPLQAPRATLERYEELQALQSIIFRYHKATGKRCPAELIPQFIGLEGKRIEVTYPNGEKTRFWIGKSSGWIPCHLEIETRRASGGSAVYFPDGSSFRILEGGRS